VAAISDPVIRAAINAAFRAESEVIGFSYI
jgi:hypothetical protein